MAKQEKKFRIVHTTRLREANAREIAALQSSVQSAMTKKADPPTNWLRDQLELDYLSRPQNRPRPEAPRKKLTSYLSGISEGRKREREEMIAHLLLCRKHA